MVWKDTPTLKGRDFELLLDYNWIKKGGGDVTEAVVCSNVSFCLGLWGAVSPVLVSGHFQSWGHKLRTVKWHHV